MPSNPVSKDGTHFSYLNIQCAVKESATQVILVHAQIVCSVSRIITGVPSGFCKAVQIFADESVSGESQSRTVENVVIIISMQEAGGLPSIV